MPRRRADLQQIWARILDHTLGRLGNDALRETLLAVRPRSLSATELRLRVPSGVTLVGLNEQGLRLALQSQIIRDESGA